MPQDAGNVDEPRRRLLAASFWCVSAATAALFATPVLGPLLTPLLRRREPVWARACAVSDLAEGVPAKVFVSTPAADGYSTAPRRVLVWLMRAPDGPVAFSAECTHMGCNVDWQAGVSRFVCPCHGGEYDAKGSVVAGPPPRGLDRLPLEVRGGEVWLQV